MPRISTRPCSQVGHLDHLLLRSHGVVDGGDRHEDQADGEQHLVEMAARIELLVERPLEHEPDDGRHGKGQGKRQEERHAIAVHQNGRHVAAGHGEGAMRQVDEVHQSERHGKPAGQHEQQHAIGNAVKEDGQHRSLQASSGSAVDGRRFRQDDQLDLAAFTGSLTFGMVANSTL